MVNEAKKIRAFVWKKINMLSQSGENSTQRAVLAELRRGVGKAPGSMPRLWSVTLDGMPTELFSKNGTPSRGEWAVHTALTLFALHQQGNDPKTKSMNREGVSLGDAVRILSLLDGGSEEAVRKRFGAAATSDSFDELAWHLRGLIQLLKAKEIALDYPALAEDLYWYQASDAKDSVRLRWGQDYYQRSKGDEVETDDNKRKVDKTNEE